jgi:CelD/BcsL family acetyltransferase involved in cellulose biosynthesis
MEVEVIKGSELSEEMKLLWHYFQVSRKELSNPFFCHEFISIVSSCRGDVYVALILENSKIIGFFPFQRGMLGIASPVGGAISDYHGYISKVEIDFENNEIFKKAGISRWKFDHLISEQTASFSNDISLDVSPIIDVINGYEHYKEGMRNSGSKIINKINRWRRKLEEEFGSVRVELCSKKSDELQICIEGKRRQFLESGIVDPFSEPWLVEMLEKIHAFESPDFSGMLSVLYAGDKIIATHMGMRSKNVWHYWFPTYDHAFAKFSPGLILLASIIEGACGMKMSHIDLGKGNSMYKSRIKNNEIILAEGVANVRGMNINILFNMISKYEGWLEKQSKDPKVLNLPIRIIRRLQRDSKFK